MQLSNAAVQRITLRARYAPPCLFSGSLDRAHANADAERQIALAEYLLSCVL